MNSSTTRRLSEMPVMRPDTKSIPPIRLNTPTSAVAPIPIQTIMPTVCSVRREAVRTSSSVSSPRRSVESSTPSTPTADASVTLAMPP